MKPLLPFLQGFAPPMSLRLSLFNPIDPARPVAERELALRLADAMTGLGWQPAIHHRSEEVRAFDPDAVLNLFPVAAPKLTAHPWLGCAWGPPALLDALSPADRAQADAHELSHDAYLVSGPVLERGLADRLAAVGRSAPFRPLHVSSPRSGRTPGLGPHSRLFYVGSNWDGRRFPHLLSCLAEAGLLALHGAAERWSHLPDAYQGELPFDGRAVIDAAHYWGMGLCLHLPQHRADGVPNMRIFELAAAGTVIIADRHPFVEQWFGDSVLYIDTEGGEAAAAAQILDRVAWVRAHPAAARDMAATAQAIFNRHLCLEALLAPVPDLLADLGRAGAAGPGMVAVLLPGGADLDHRLSMLAAQRAAPARLALVPGTGTLPAAPPGLTLRALPGPADSDGLRAVMGEATALAVLPPGVEWHTDHLARMIAESGAPGAALAAALWPRPPGPMALPANPAETTGLAPLAAGDDPVLALLRAGGLFCDADRLRGLGLSGADWLALALDLPPALARQGGLALRAVPGLRWAGRAPVPPAGTLTWVAPAPPPRPARPPRLTGMNDLSPALAAHLPWLWHKADFDSVPPTGPIWLYGSGRGGELVMAALPPAARDRVGGFLDSRRQGRFLGLKLCRPQDLAPAEMAQAVIIIAGQYVSDMLRCVTGCAVAPACILNAYPYIADQVAVEMAGPPVPQTPASISDRT